MTRKKSKFAEPHFYTFLEKWLQIKWSIDTNARFTTISGMSKIKFFQMDWAFLLTFLLIQYLVQNRCRNEKQSRVGKVKAIPTRPSVKYLTGQSLARTRSEGKKQKAHW